ncbi:MAG: adenylosuccinate synthase [Candidatus Eisenbacteria bacterium]|nr:adenylosuccinate synthase [Candidatus Eisenbacteria bacterium]
MPASVVVGAQWGDEGKGKIVDMLSERADAVVRYQGGANAGHTVVVGGKTVVLHLVPCGILRPGKLCYLGNGVVVDPEALFREVAFLEAASIDVEGRLFVSFSAHVILSYHRVVEDALERTLGDGKIGTAGRGIGPAYRDKAGRVGVRVCDLLDPKALRDKIEVLAGQARMLEREVGKATNAPAPGGSAVEDPAAVLASCLEFGHRLRPMMVDVSSALNRALDEGKTLLFEGAQGTLLDLDHGTYPFVSSSSATAGGACTGTGVGPTRIDEVIGVAKAYTTRVGNGPFPTELPPEESSALREAGGEYGATTGRPRRCGWFDAVVVRHSVRVNGIDRLYLTKLDVLDGTRELKICTAYRRGGETLRGFPASVGAAFEAEPVYESHPGWEQPVKGTGSGDRLPPAALAYVRRIEQLTGARVAGVSVGSGREEMVFLS